MLISEKNIAPAVEIIKANMPVCLEHEIYDAVPHPLVREVMHARMSMLRAMKEEGGDLLS